MLKETPKATGTRGQLKGKNASGAAMLAAPEDDIPTLEELGVSKRESAQAQKLVEMAEGDATGYVEERLGKERSTA